jgi:hypothetical protein
MSYYFPSQHFFFFQVPVNVDFSGWDAAFTANFEYQKVTSQVNFSPHFNKFAAFDLISMLLMIFSFIQNNFNCRIYWQLFIIFLLEL